MCQLHANTQPLRKVANSGHGPVSRFGAPKSRRGKLARNFSFDNARRGGVYKRHSLARAFSIFRSLQRQRKEGQFQAKTSGPREVLNSAMALLFCRNNIPPPSAMIAHTGIAKDPEQRVVRHGNLFFPLPPRSLLDQTQFPLGKQVGRRLVILPLVFALALAPAILLLLQVRVRLRRREPFPLFLPRLFFCHESIGTYYLARADKVKVHHHRHCKSRKSSWQSGWSPIILQCSHKKREGKEKRLARSKSA